jgi:hypothetical protein
MGLFVYLSSSALEFKGAVLLFEIYNIISGRTYKRTLVQSSYAFEPKVVAEWLA